MRRLWVLWLALLPLAAWAQEAEDAALDAGLEIVEAPAIELVIVGPGEDFTTLYGHAAMRVVDDPSRPETARVFNFGITAFDNPDLTREFIGGRVVFWGDVGPYDATLAGWKRDDRTVTRYPVLLGDGARRRLLARLEHDVAPAHRQYIYDTFRENCSTRLRDVLDTYSGGTVFATHGGVDGGRAFRQDVREAYSNRSGLLLATELMAGADTDRPRTAWELMYRPEYMAERLVEVVLPGGKPLLGAPAVDHTRQGADPRNGSPHHGQIFWGALAVLAGLLGWWIRGRGPRVRGGVLAVAALLSSLIGGTMLWVGLTSAWPEMQRNPSILVFVPLDLALLWPAGRLLLGGFAWGPIARPWLIGRLVVGGALVALTPLLDPLAGPLPPRLLGVALTFLALRCLDGRSDRFDDRTEELSIVPIHR